MGSKNALITAPGYGTFQVTCLGLGFGQQLDASTLESRRFVAFYSHITTSEEWYINLRFKSWTEYDDFNAWLTGYFNRITDPTQTPLMPVWVNILNAKRNFQKRGYPVTSAEYGDEFGKIVYDMTLQFVTADEASLDPAIGSKYVPPISDAVARSFSPSLLPHYSGSVLNPYNPSGAFVGTRGRS